ncbi:MAG: putative metal-binding motif-containing protein, partial [Myxococcaceae bacterium]
MKRLYWVPLVSLTAALGCRQGPAQSALLVLARLDPLNVATCVGVEVRSASDSLLAQTLMPRVPGQDEYKVAIARGELPAEVVLRAWAAFGAGGGCDEPQARSGESARVPALFGVQVGRVELEVASPGPLEDVDGDGFLDEEQGGPDCDDRSAAAHPGAPEDCAGGVDLDCDGQEGCDDPECAPGSCAGPAVALFFATPAQTVQAGACSAEVQLELRDASGRRARAPADLPVSLSAASAGGFDLFSDPVCLTPSAEVLVPGRSTGVGFFFAGQKAQTVEVSATAPGMAPSSQTEQVQPGPLAGLSFETQPLMLLAGGCSGAVRLAARDLFGNLAPPAAPLPVDLRASPDAGFLFFADNACLAPGTPGLDAGQSLSSFSFRGWSPGLVEIFAGAGGLPPTAQTERLVPQVRSAQCAIDAGETRVSCPLDAP